MLIAFGLDLLAMLIGAIGSLLYIFWFTLCCCLTLINSELDLGFAELRVGSVVYVGFM